VAVARSGRARWRVGCLFASVGGTALNRPVGSRSILVRFGALLRVAAIEMIRGPRGRDALAAEDTRARPNGARRGRRRRDRPAHGFFDVGVVVVVVPVLSLGLGRR
jgi:hypothetical protein